MLLRVFLRHRMKPLTMGISFQYPYNSVKFEAGFDQGVLNDFEGVVSFDI